MKFSLSRKALKNAVREALAGIPVSNMTDTADGMPPVTPNPVVDPMASVTDPMNTDFVPKTKQELDVALKQLSAEVPVDCIPSVYKTFKDAVDSENIQAEKDKEMKKTSQNGDKVEEQVRQMVRKVLNEMNEAEGDRPLPPIQKIPMGVHGGEYLRRMKKSRDDLAKSFRAGKAEDPIDDPDAELGDDDSPKKRHSYKKTALGSMKSVAGATFEDIAKEFGLSVAGAKQAVDKALEKARWAGGADEDELEIVTLQAMIDYIEMLNKSGELTSADVQLMKDHPDIVRDLDGFREFLDGTIRRLRKDGQKLDNPLGESKNLKEAPLGGPPRGKQVSSGASLKNAVQKVTNSLKAAGLTVRDEDPGNQEDHEIVRQVSAHKDGQPVSASEHVEAALGRPTVSFGDVKTWKIGDAFAMVRGPVIRVSVTLPDR